MAIPIAVLTHYPKTNDIENVNVSPSDSQYYLKKLGRNRTQKERFSFKICKSES